MKTLFILYAYYIEINLDYDGVTALTGAGEMNKKNVEIFKVKQEYGTAEHYHTGVFYSYTQS